MEEKKQPRGYHRLEKIEETDDFVALLERSKLTRNLDAEHPYCIWSMNYSDQEHGFLSINKYGLNIADLRRGAEQIEMPLTLITPFYAWRSIQKIEKLHCKFEHDEVDIKNYGFNFVDSIMVKIKQKPIEVDIFEKQLGSTRILAVKEGNFGEYGTADLEQQIYQAVVLGFVGYYGLKLVGLKPSLSQLSGPATCFAAIARLDELVSEGMNIYEAIVFIRKNCLFVADKFDTESKYTRQQFIDYVLPNIKSEVVKTWLIRNFQDENFSLFSIARELSELKISAIQNLPQQHKDWRLAPSGISLSYWSGKESYSFLKDDILDQFDLRSETAGEKIDTIESRPIREIKEKARLRLNKSLNKTLDQYGKPIALPNETTLMSYPAEQNLSLLFSDPDRLADFLEEKQAHLVFCCNLRQSDNDTVRELQNVLKNIDATPVLKQRVYYLPDADEKILKDLFIGSDIILNLEEGLNWMRAIANLNILISIDDNDVIKSRDNACLVVTGDSREEQIESLFIQLGVAIDSHSNDFDFEYWIRHELDEFIGIISVTRMLRDYLKYIF